MFGDSRGPRIPRGRLGKLVESGSERVGQGICVFSEIGSVGGRKAGCVSLAVGKAIRTAEKGRDPAGAPEEEEEDSSEERSPRTGRISLEKVRREKRETAFLYQLISGDPERSPRGHFRVKDARQFFIRAVSAAGIEFFSGSTRSGVQHLRNCLGADAFFTFTGHEQSRANSSGSKGVKKAEFPLRSHHVLISFPSFTGRLIPFREAEMFFSGGNNFPPNVIKLFKSGHHVISAVWKVLRSQSF